MATKKGGYITIDLKNVDLASDDLFIKGIYKSLTRVKGKNVMFLNLVSNDLIRDVVVSVGIRYLDSSIVCDCSDWTVSSGFSIIIDSSDEITCSYN